MIADWRLPIAESSNDECGMMKFDTIGRINPTHQ